VEGFKIEQRFVGNGCDQLPYVVDFDEGDNIDKLFKSVFQAKGIESFNGTYELKIYPHCAWQILQSEQISAVPDGCGEIALSDLSSSSNELSLDDWRREKEKESRVERISYAGKYIAIGSIIFGLIIVWPFLIIRQWLKSNSSGARNRILIIIQSIVIIILFFGTIFIGFNANWIAGLSSLMLIAILAEIIYVIFCSRQRTASG